ncbi:hypothetical protein F8271_03950 [Micromonospora sp. ALFpr18c]|uniref:hypothetical protein n=1 Tax=unclassified Micromonospora TaxID=2617518 RepID=UPI00124B28E9|nr:hypothetical protein [Micromonospora sp. ALFpr18c]KAB1947683.1 hypothetical protein F8271_03950 [Micromonospora sp. ALFpr18c]
MMRKHLTPFVALLAAGAATLTACGSNQVPPGPARAADLGASQAASPNGGAGVGGLALVPGTAKSNNSQPGTGDWAVPNGGVATGATQESAQRWVQLTASKAGKLDPVVVNGAGLTLYRFDKDSNEPPVSNCDGDCAVTWPPVTVSPGGKIFVAGVRKEAVGTVARADGSRQVTINGWPIYRFAKDTKPGDTNGQGVGGTWFGVTPTGGKAGVAGGDEPAPDTAPAQPATSAVFFDDPAFGDGAGSQGVAGTGCKNLSRPGVASSVAAPGSLKIWTGQDCTGRSKVINGDVADLATVDFDNAVVSVRLG